MAPNLNRERAEILILTLIEEVRAMCVHMCNFYVHRGREKTSRIVEIFISLPQPHFAHSQLFSSPQK